MIATINTNIMVRYLQVQARSHKRGQPKNHLHPSPRDCRSVGSSSPQRGGVFIHIYTYIVLYCIVYIYIEVYIYIYYVYIKDLMTLIMGFRSICHILSFIGGSVKHTIVTGTGLIRFEEGLGRFKSNSVPKPAPVVRLQGIASGKGYTRGLLPGTQPLSPNEGLQCILNGNSLGGWGWGL